MTRMRWNCENRAAKMQTRMRVGGARESSPFEFSAFFLWKVRGIREISRSSPRISRFDCSGTASCLSWTKFQSFTLFAAHFPLRFGAIGFHSGLFQLSVKISKIILEFPNSHWFNSASCLSSTKFKPFQQALLAFLKNFSSLFVFFLLISPKFSGIFRNLLFIPEE